MKMQKITLVLGILLALGPVALGQTMVNVTAFEPQGTGMSYNGKDPGGRGGDLRGSCPDPRSLMGGENPSGQGAAAIPTPTPSATPTPRPSTRSTPRSTQKYHGVYLTRHIVNVRIVDGVSITEIDQTFHNAGWRRMEGTYVCPLPRNAVLNRFSIFMAGKEVQGKVMERAKGRQTYETIVSRLKDPGLVELLQGGRPRIQTRIFPIPARGNMRVKLQYAHVLDQSRGQLRARVPLRALGRSKAPPLTRLKIGVKARSSWPLKRVYTRDYKLAGLGGTNKKTWSGTFAATRIKPGHDLNLRCVAQRKDSGLAVHTYTAPGGERFFMAVLAAGESTLREVTIRFEGAKAVDIYPAKLPSIGRHRQCLVFGKLQGTGPAEVFLQAAVGGGILHRVSIGAKDRGKNTNDFIAGIWATHKVRYLLPKGKLGKEEIIALGIRYGILTPYTAFLAK